ncbi:MAG: hypothetical protein Q4G69_06455 [Planctomycetia bacterium]|nr:hypothetical protein [Planctomycetia bacterium]
MKKLKSSYIMYIILILGLITSTGCSSALMFPLFLIKGTDVDPEFKKEVKSIPKKSKMVVIARTGSKLFGSENPSAPLSNCITLLLSNKIDEKKKLEWIPYEKVESTFDDETLLLENFTRMGKELEADYVIGVDIDHFSTQLSSQLYQGRSKVQVQMIEVKTGKAVVRKTMPEFVYPPTPTTANGKHPTEFQKNYIGKLSEEIGNLFCAYDPHKKYAMDSDFPDR